jgi:hypothetical protein
MDTSNFDITFDERGSCDYRKNYHKNIFPGWRVDKEDEKNCYSSQGKSKLKVRVKISTASLGEVVD